jgi:hypothetical protein
MLYITNIFIYKNIFEIIIILLIIEDRMGNNNQHVKGKLILI